MFVIKPTMAEITDTEEHLASNLKKMENRKAVTFLVNVFNVIM